MGRRRQRRDGCTTQHGGGHGVPQGGEIKCFLDIVFHLSEL
jgi:hypothetical protein